MTIPFGVVESQRKLMRELLRSWQAKQVGSKVPPEVKFRETIFEINEPVLPAAPAANVESDGWPQSRSMDLLHFIERNGL